MGFFQTMNGIFGNGKAERAMALAKGDYAGAAQINQMRAKQRQGEQDAENEAAAMQDAYKYFRSVGLAHEAAITAARDPEVRGHMVRDRSGFHTQNSVDMVNNKSIFMPTEREIDGVNVRTDSGGRSQATYETPYPKIITNPDGSADTIDRMGVGAINQRMGGAMPPPSAFGGQADPLAPRPGGPVTVRSPQDIEALPEGAEYIAPDGRRYRKNGGQSARPTGGFRPY